MRRRMNSSAQKSTLSDQKPISAERPYSYSLVLVFFAILLTAKGLYNAIAGVIPTEGEMGKLAQAGLLAALCYIGFASSRSTPRGSPRRPHSIWATDLRTGSSAAGRLLGRTCRCHRHDHRRSGLPRAMQPVKPQDLLIKIVHRSDRRTGCSQDLPSEQRAFRKICDRRNDFLLLPAVASLTQVVIPPLVTSIKCICWVCLRISLLQDQHRNYRCQRHRCCDLCFRILSGTSSKY